MSFWMIVLSSFAVLAFLLSGVFLIKKGEPNRLYAVILFLFSFNIVFNIIYWNYQQERIYAYFIFAYLIPLSLYGPLFYLYIKTIIAKSNLGSKDIIHFLPLFTTLILYGGIFFLNPEKKLELFYNKTIFEFIIYYPWYDELLTISLMYYSVISLLKVYKSIDDNNEIKLWLLASSISFVAFAFSYCSYYVLVNLSLMKIEYDYIITFLMCISITITTYFVYTHPKVFNGTSIIQVAPFIKYKTTGLNSDNSIELKNRLRNIMKEERPYLDSELRLDDLAKKLKVNRSQASQVINEHFAMNFFDFVNKYRIQEAESLLINSNLTISEIAYQSGFNNKVSFYKSFRKYKKMTPSQHREKMLSRKSNKGIK